MHLCFYHLFPPNILVCLCNGFGNSMPVTTTLTFLLSQMSEFRQKTKDTFPSMRKNEQQGRSEFASVRELVHYLLDEDERVKAEKKRPSS